MRVLHVFKTYFPDPEGGIQEAIRQICQATQLLGVNSTVFCLSPHWQPARLEEDNGQVTWRSRSFAAPASCDLGGPDAWRLFSSLAKEHDLIHYHFPWPFADLLHVTVRPRAPSVMTYHSDIVRQSSLAKFYAPLMWRMLMSMDRIVATSLNYLKTSPVLSDERLKNRVRIIPLGIEDLASGQALQSLGGASPYILFVGVLRYYKGLQTLLQAAGQVKARILIAGDGPRGTELRKMAGGLRLTNVEFLGRVSHEEKLRLLAGCSGFVLPSHQRSEAFGMSLVEAAMFSKPMVSCEIGTGTTFINTHMETGLIVPPGDPIALAEALNRLLDEPDLSARLGRKARERYESLFSASALGIAYAELYREVVEQ